MLKSLIGFLVAITFVTTDSAAVFANPEQISTNKDTCLKHQPTYTFIETPHFSIYFCGKYYIGVNKESREKVILPLYHIRTPNSYIAFLKNYSFYINDKALFINRMDSNGKPTLIQREPILNKKEYNCQCDDFDDNNVPPEYTF